MKSLLLLFLGWIVAIASFDTSASIQVVSPVKAPGRISSLRAIYLAEAGVREATNHNDGSRVEGYLHYVGLKKGQPWCAAYVCFCLGKAGIHNPRSGYCPDLFPADKVIWEKGKSSGKAESSRPAETPPATRNSQPATAISQPATCDVFGLFFPEKGRIAHVGFIDEWGEKYALTCEGNTNEAGSRDGDGVYCKRRLISSLYKIARFD